MMLAFDEADGLAGEASFADFHAHVSAMAEHAVVLGAACSEDDAEARSWCGWEENTSVNFNACQVEVST